MYIPQEKLQVILIRSLKLNVDYRAISAFVEHLNDQLVQQVGAESKPSPLKLTIIVDDASVGIRHLTRLRDFLTSRGRSVLIVAWREERMNGIPCIVRTRSISLPMTSLTYQKSLRTPNGPNLSRTYINSGSFNPRQLLGKITLGQI